LTTLIGGLALSAILTPILSPPPSPTPYQPKYLAGQCVLLSDQPLVRLRIEMVDREASLYLVRVTPSSIYRSQMGAVLSAEDIDRLPTTLCPNQT
jgi:hypothetical protein